MEPQQDQLGNLIPYTMAGVISLILISILPFLFLFTQGKVLGSFTYTFANISGFIGAVFLLWEFILGIREIARKISPNPAVFMKLHIFLGVWGLFFVLIHPILEMFSYLENISFLFLPDISTSFDIHITYGRIAFFLTILVWLTSSFLRKNLNYKKWLNIHYLSYPLMFFVFIHALDIGSFLHTFIFIKIYWFILIILYACLVIWRISLVIIKPKINFTPLQK
jgi:DMSO/TMAO reductase YedYZ heme-binding membrane subunit